MDQEATATTLNTEHLVFRCPAARTAQSRGPLAILGIHPAIDARACTYAALGRSTLTIEVFRALDEAERWLTAATLKG